MNRIIKDAGRNILMLVVPPLVGTFLLWRARLNDVTPLELLAATGLLASAWIPYHRWRVAGDRYLPILPMIGFMFWVYYALPLFWGDRWGYTRGQLSDESVEQAMLLAVIGVACLWIGKWTSLGRRLVSRKVPDIQPNYENTWSYIRIVILLSIPLTFVVQSRAYVLGSGGRQLLMILASTAPLALFVMLLRKFLRRQVNHAEVLLIGVFVVSRFLSGIASGWLGASVGIMIICSIAYVYERRKIPSSAIILVLAYVLFFQAGKEAFRKTFWGERVDSTVSQRISFWSSESLRNWELTLANPSEESWRLLLDRSLGRMSLLQQTAHVLELTPDEVPYQHGRLYSYMVITLIPRAFWPEKPSVNEANQFYQVAYGVTDPDQLESVSIAVGTLAESFINFGWWGPFAIMIPLGIFFDYFQHTFLTRNSGWVLNAIGIALIPSFLAVEAQLAQYMAGIVQCVVVVLLVLQPVSHMRPRGESALPPGTHQLGADGQRIPMSRRFL